MIESTTPARALAVFAHPDDPEVGCGGTLARWAALGCEVHLVIANRGDKGSFDASTDPDALAAHRADEVERAAAVLGLAGVEHLGYPDGEIENDSILRSRLTEIVRRRRPEALVAPDPTAVFFGESYVNHRDHRQLGWAVLDSLVPAASPLYVPEAGPAHQVGLVLLSGTLEADAWVDIDAFSTTCVGLAASMGTVLLSAGAKGRRYALPNSTIHIHQPWGGAQGQAVDIEIEARRIMRERERLNLLLAKHTGQTVERIIHDTDRNYYMDAVDAVAYGLIDEVLISAKVEKKEEKK